MSGTNQLENFAPEKTKDLISNTIFSEYIATYNYNTGLFGKISLNNNITYDWFKAANGELSGDEIKKLGLPDSDGDGKYDFEEINMSYLKFDKYGNVIIPTFEELYVQMYNKYFSKEISSEKLNTFIDYYTLKTGKDPNSIKKCLC